MEKNKDKYLKTMLRYSKAHHQGTWETLKKEEEKKTCVIQILFLSYSSPQYFARPVLMPNSKTNLPERDVFFFL